MTGKRLAPSRGIPVRRSKQKWRKADKNVRAPIQISSARLAIREQLAPIIRLEPLCRTA